MQSDDNQKQKTKTIDHTSQGMLYGMFVGGALATLLVANTGNGVYYTLVGLCMVIGLALGAIYEKRQKDRS